MYLQEYQWKGYKLRAFYVISDISSAKYLARKLPESHCGHVTSCWTFTETIWIFLNLIQTNSNIYSQTCVSGHLY